MKYCFFLVGVSLLVNFDAIAITTVKNDTTENLVKDFDAISYRWDLVAADLEQYNGLGAFCIERSYRTEVLSLLKDVHHLDSLVYHKLLEIARTRNNGEIKKTIKQIEELESQYGIKEFSEFLSQECKERKEIERAKRDLEANLGQDSYSGQQQLIESTLYRYIHHVTYLVDHIRKHIHHLHLEDYD